MRTRISVSSVHTSGGGLTFQSVVHSVRAGTRISVLEEKCTINFYFLKVNQTHAESNKYSRHSLFIGATLPFFGSGVFRDYLDICGCTWLISVVGPALIVCIHPAPCPSASSETSLSITHTTNLQPLPLQLCITMAYHQTLQQMVEADETRYDSEHSLSGEGYQNGLLPDPMQYEASSGGDDTVVR